MHHRSLGRCLVFCAVLISLVFNPLLFSIPVARANDTLMIGEVAWAGSSLSSADEWVEIWNVGVEEISLAGYSLHGAGSHSIILPTEAVIPAHGVYLISNYPETDQKSILEHPPSLVTSTISLSNSSIHLTFIDPNGVMIDSVGDGAAPLAGANADTKASMIFHANAWTTASTSSGIKVGIADFGTPGFCDGCLSEFIEFPFDTTSTEPVFELPSMETTSSTESLSTETYATSTIIDPLAGSTTPLDPTATTQTASSTLETPIASSSTSTTIASSTAASNTTSTTIITNSSQPAALTTSTTAAETNSAKMTAPTSSTPFYDRVRLNEIMAQPEGENEWIELTLTQFSDAVPLKGFKLEDQTGAFLTIATGTLHASEPFIRINLKTSRLNNSGDLVALRDPGGIVRDSVIYDSSEKNHSWIRVPDGVGEWHLTETATPNAANLLTVASDTEEELNRDNEETFDDTTTEANSVTSAHSSLPSKASNSKLTTTISSSASTAKTATSKTTKTPSASSKSSSTTSTKSTAKKPTSSKTQPAATPIIPLEINMTANEDYRNIRISLQGTVGSPPGLLSSNAFALLSEDGHGIQVRLPTGQKLPNLGDSISVQGTLSFTTLGVPYLKLSSKDSWRSLAPKHLTPALIRAVDIAIPGAEDAWSLVQATGTVRTVRSTSAVLEVDDVEVELAIKPVLKYRAVRLKVGDQIQVTGLLEMTADKIKLIPRNSSEIEIIAHVEAQTAAKTTSRFPDWAPIGAAGITIAASHGLRHLHKKRKTKKLQTLANDSS